jgi:hypothetical protein
MNLSEDLMNPNKDLSAKAKGDEIDFYIALLDRPGEFGKICFSKVLKIFRLRQKVDRRDFDRFALLKFIVPMNS